MNPFNSNNQPDFLADIAAFHERFGLSVEDGPFNQPDLSLLNFRSKTHVEEAKEFQDAAEQFMDTGNPECLAKMLDACVDQVYFVLGTAYVMGWDFSEAWKRVHAANMEKVRAAKASDSKRGSKFDVVKPPDWVAPSLLDLTVPSEPSED